MTDTPRHPKAVHYDPRRLTIPKAHSLRSSGSVRDSRIYALLLIVSGLAVNNWTLGRLFAPDKSIDADYKLALIAFFQIFCILSGIIVLRKRHWFTNLYFANTPRGASFIVVSMPQWAKKWAVLPIIMLMVGGSIIYFFAGKDRFVTVQTDWIHLSSKRGELPTPGKSDQQTASLVFDVDKDGLNDFVIGARDEPPSMVWFRRLAYGWERHVIDAELLPIEAGGAYYDIDSDGDTDIVMGEDYSGNKVYWWENPYPDVGRAWNRYVIKGSGANKHHDQMFVDIDGDEKAELVFWNQGANTLFFAETPADPQRSQPWPYLSIFISPSESEGLAQADIDGDGKADLVAAGRWFKHMGGTTFVPEVIDDDMRFSRAAAGQLKKGGWPEVVFVVGDDIGRLKWYERDGQSWLGHDLLGVDVIHGHSLQIADINEDGNLDIFCAEMHTPGHKIKATAWIFYGDGKGQFAKEVVSTGLGNHESRVADLDGDGDKDLLIKPYTWDAPRVDVLLNTPANFDRWQRHVVDAERPWRAVFIDAADMDGDGLKDIITGAWWYRNPGEPASQWQRRAIGDPLYNMAAVYDFDGDGDIDILGTEGKGSEANASLVWARNEGKGNFAVMKNISQADGDFLQGVAIDRLNSAELQVALSWHSGRKGIQMLEVPSSPSTARWLIAKIVRISQDEALSVGDIDGDGAKDLLLGTKWLRNRGGTWEALSLSGDEGLPDRNRLADINGDGRLDAVVGFEAVSVPGDVVWYENSADGIWRKHVIATVIGPMSLDLGDLDKDKDLDVVVGEHDLHDSSKAKLHVFENADGRGGKWIGHVVAVGDEHHDGAILVDIDNDEDLDIISIGWGHDRVLLYENRLTAGY